MIVKRRYSLRGRRHQCWKTYPRPDEHLVLSAPVGGGEVKIAAASHGRLTSRLTPNVRVRYVVHPELAYYLAVDKTHV